MHPRRIDAHDEMEIPALKMIFRFHISDTDWRQPPQEKFVALCGNFATKLAKLYDIWKLVTLILIERLHARLRNAYYTLIFIGRKLHEEVVNGVNANIVIAHFVMKVWRKRQTRVTR